MPYTVRKQKCKKSDGGSGSYVLSYTDKKGKKHRACHTSRKKAKGQIAAIEMETAMRTGNTIQEKNMKIRLSQLRTLIKEEITRLLEVADPEAAFSVMENEDLISIADTVRGMSRKKVPPTNVLKYLEGALTGDVAEAIQYVLDHASPEQLKELEFEAIFGDVDALTDEYARTPLKNPFDAVQVVKTRLAKNQDVQSIDVIGLQLRNVQTVLEDILEDEKEFDEPVPAPRRRGGIFSFLSR